MPNPLRSSSQYRRLRAQWLKHAPNPSPCALCGMPVDTTLPGTHPWGPTIEHAIPIRWTHTLTRDSKQAHALACDTSQWAIAHKRCQDRQGAHAANAVRRTRVQPNASRRW